jgi:hypothetical protein
MFRSLVISIVLTIAATGAAAAQDRRQPLPEFTVVAAAGGEVASGALTHETRYLLVYVVPGCKPCESLVHALGKWQSPDLIARTVLIVQGPAADAQTFLSQRLAPELAAMPWYADPERKAAVALGLTGAPVLVGVRDGRIEWTLGGVLNNPAALESVVRTWVESIQ